MPRKRPTPHDLLMRSFLRHQAGVKGHRMINIDRDGDIDELPTLEERLRLILDLVNKKDRKSTNMIFFVMYDIASDKVRRAVVKYLERRGCHRVQRSIFLADTPPDTCQEIQSDLAAVQAMYDNKDSIFIVPLSIDYIRSMKVIGENIDFDLILKTRSTLFF